MKVILQPVNGMNFTEATVLHMRIPLISIQAYHRPYENISERELYAKSICNLMQTNCHYFINMTFVGAH